MMDMNGGIKSQKVPKGAKNVQKRVEKLQFYLISANLTCQNNSKKEVRVSFRAVIIIHSVLQHQQPSLDAG